MRTPEGNSHPNSSEMGRECPSFARKDQKKKTPEESIQSSLEGRSPPMYIVAPLVSSWTVFSLFSDCLFEHFRVPFRGRRVTSAPVPAAGSFSLERQSAVGGHAFFPSFARALRRPYLFFP